MSDPGYTFVPWVRRGAAALANGTPATNYLSLSLQATVNATAASAVGIRLYGPADVTGVDERVISRREPAPDTSTFEPNYLPAIEFAVPDFPWLFSPAVPAGTKLQPWVCLVVVRVQPGVSLVNRAQGLPLLQFAAPAVPLDELPDLAEIASWAHAQQTGSDTLDQGISRIVCPRRLQASTAYLACLVPTYHAGVSAGTSPDLPRSDSDVAPAWDASVVAPFALPVYASWRFATSDADDFASLVRRLRPPTTPLVLGSRDMDASAPGFGMPAFAGLTLGLEGALMSTSTTATPWPAGVEATFDAALRPILDPPAADVPLIAPPTYGGVAAGSTLPADGADPVWLRTLNLDPRWRAVAGIAGSIVAAARETLVASAWDQFEAVRNANQVLRQLQLGREVSAAVRTLQMTSVASSDTFLQLIRPLHARLRLGGASQTISGQLLASRVPAGAVSAAFRRLTRRRGPVARALFAPGAAALRIVARLNAATGATGALVVATPRVPPNGTVLLESVSPTLTTAQLAPGVVNAAGGWFATTISTTTETKSAAATPAVHAAAIDVTKAPVETSPVSAAPPAGPVAPIQVIAKLPVIPAKGLGDVPPLATDKNTQLEMVLRFRGAAAAVTTYISTKTTKISDAPVPPPLAADLDDVRTLALAAIDPATTILARARARIPVPLPTTGDPLAPLLVTPSFPQATSRELDPSRLLPGVETIEPDTVVMLETNPTFVEAFMIGLNDEMRRELAWRQYPCDARGTFFSQFWTDAGSGVPPDIPAIAGWKTTNDLGANATTASAETVLLVRGELLRRFPNAVISAVQAVAASNGTRTLGTTQLFPVFMGTIAPDIVYFGFALAPAAAIAGAGWYFVISEHPAEPRFGFEAQAASTAATTWNDVAWTQIDVVNNHIALAASTLNPLEGIAWNAGAASQACIAFRRPVRVALHASAIVT